MTQAPLLSYQCYNGQSLYAVFTKASRPSILQNRTNYAEIILEKPKTIRVRVMIGLSGCMSTWKVKKALSDWTTSTLGNQTFPGQLANPLWTCSTAWLRWPESCRYARCLRWSTSRPTLSLVPSGCPWPGRQVNRNLPTDQSDGQFSFCCRRRR